MAKRTQIKNEGVVFTPSWVASEMVKLINPTPGQRILEPCCGEGAILEHIPTIHTITGVELNPQFANTCRVKFPNIDIQNLNFLDYSIQENERFDCIIGNPPYVKIQNMCCSEIDRMRKDYPKDIRGNTNLYIYFLLKCIDLLNDNGELIFLIPNTLFYNKSLRTVWNKLLYGRHVKHIIDFRDTQLFEGISIYTCILHLSKAPNPLPYYIYKKGLDGEKIKKPFNEHEKESNQALFHAKIGLMTLCDKVFIIKEWEESPDKSTFTFTKNNQSYTIETSACRDILKVSKNEIHRIIYPYILKNNKPVIQNNFMNAYPKAYAYLEAYRHLLDKRDAGKVNKYPAWFAYGRSQSLTCYNELRLFLPSLINSKIPIVNQCIETKCSLYYSGLCLEPKHTTPTESIKSWLHKNNQNILNRSNIRSGGWYAISQGSFLSSAI